MTDTWPSIAPAMHQAVARQYEAYPYPDYGLLLPLRWQEAYASTALFSGLLTREHGLTPAIDAPSPLRILIAGCGDILPAVLARWEPRSHQLHGLDLSRRSLLRARLRTWLGGRALTIQQGDIADPQLAWAGPYAHIDAYGVLHHLANPSEALAQLCQQLAPGGTLRLMVYNREARAWIHHLQRAFALLGLDPYSPTDLRQAALFLQSLQRRIPSLQAKLQSMARSTLLQSARLVDTFLHAREARIDLDQWLRWLASCGLEVLGLYDRYAELDDLPNPLLRMPDRSQLTARASDGRYENNLEIYCRLRGPGPTEAIARRARPLASWRWTPPQTWRSYEETQQLSSLLVWRLWQTFCQRLYGRPATPLDPLLRRIPIAAQQRLARLGVLWPSMIGDRGLREELMRPLCTEMEQPFRAPPYPAASDAELSKIIARILDGKGRSQAYQPLVLQRIQAASQAAWQSDR